MQRQMIPNKGADTIQRGKDGLFTKDAGKTGYQFYRRMKLDLTLHNIQSQLKLDEKT